MHFSASGRAILLPSGEVKFIRIFAGITPSEGVKVRHSHVYSENLTKIGRNLETVQECKLELITNRKSHIHFRLVPKWVTLNDLERFNGRVVCVISQNSVDFGINYVKVIEDRPIPSASEMYRKESSFSAISFMAIIAGNHS